MKKYSVDFTNIPEEYINKITDRIKEMGCTPILISRLTNHPDDERLFVVIAQYDKPHPFFDEQYVVWEASTFGEAASLFYGHYHISFKTAIEIVAEKIRDLNKEEN